MKEKLLLHSCCGPCSTAVIERLKDDYDLTVFYYNPNIYPDEEYELRKEMQKKVCSINNVPVIEGDYDPSKFDEAARGFEDAPEGGARCKECFRFRLLETAKKAKALGFDCFDTTLSVSPYKNYNTIFEVASEIAENIGVKYIAGNYKKKEGYKRSIELSKEYELYRQHYCGCKYSLRDSIAAAERKNEIR